MIGSKNGGEREKENNKKKKHVYTESISNYLQRPEMKRRGARRAAALWADSGERRLPRRSSARPPLRPVISLEAGRQPRRPPSTPPGRPVPPQPGAASHCGCTPNTTVAIKMVIFVLRRAHFSVGFFHPFSASARKRKKKMPANFLLGSVRGLTGKRLGGAGLFCFSNRLF